MCFYVCVCLYNAFALFPAREEGASGRALCLQSAGVRRFNLRGRFWQQGHLLPTERDPGEN